MGVTVVREGVGLETILKRFEDLSNYSIETGIQGTVAEGGRSTPGELAQIAAKLEYGSIEEHIPARPWMRTTFDKHKNKWRDDFLKALQPAFEGKTDLVKQVFRILGNIMVTDLQITLSEGPWAKNSEFTRREKWKRAGKPKPFRSFISQPLIDTGQLIQSHRAALSYKGQKEVVA